MKIDIKTYRNLIKELPDVPHEIGGILGGHNGVISAFAIDHGTQQGCGCFYSPDVAYLNHVIRQWQVESIEFYGIFHTHFFGVETLSDGDKTYINQIIQSMPSEIIMLYFPIILVPQRKILPYFATRNDDTVEISKEDLIIV